MLLYDAAITHGSPRPRKTLTQFEPVTFPIAESANSEDLQAVILANVSGKEVPKATNVIAVIEFGIPMTQPIYEATSPTIAVTPPMNERAIPKAGHPPPQ